MNLITMYRYFPIVSVFLVQSYLSLVESFQPYQTSIPNGYNVPHPCKMNYMWRGVGHQVPKGGGERNQFGIDFANAGKSWTVDLCQKDSDGDGKTNGEELGDPDCKWKVGTIPEQTTNITHPGICEPLESEQCMNQSRFVSCDSKQFFCDALHEPGMRNTSIRFPEMKILNEETQYYCMYFNFPLDGDYHMVANQPFIDNKDVIHHILLFGCDQQVTEEHYKPWRCGMGSYKCFSLLGIWAVGMAGECMHNLTGFRIGYRGYRSGMIQVHYNNPEKRDDFTDSSGLTIHYTPNRRQYDSRVLMLGQMYLEIPSGQAEYPVIGQCTPECSNFQFNGPINVTAGYNHMHYLGRQMKVEHFRNGTSLEDIAADEVYSYDSPVQHQYENPLVIEKGDELKVKCTYQSLSNRKTTFYGEGTSDEMCFSFLTYFPAENINYPYCLTWKSIPYCKLINGDVFPEIDGCRLQDIFNQSNPSTKLLYSMVTQNCRPFQACLPECLDLLKSYKSHPCLNGDVGDYIRMQSQKSHNMTLFFAAVDSCKMELKGEKECKCERNKCPTSKSNAVFTAYSFVFVFLQASLFVFTLYINT